MYKNTINLTDGCFPTIVVCPVERCPVRPGLVLAAAWRHCHDTRHGMDTADTAASYPSLDTEVSRARVSRVSRVTVTHITPQPAPAPAVRLRAARSMSAQTRVTSSLCRLELPAWYRSNRSVPPRVPGSHVSRVRAGRSPPRPRPAGGGAGRRAGGGGAARSPRWAGSRPLPAPAGQRGSYITLCATTSIRNVVKLRQGSGKDRQGMVKGERP